MAAYRRVSGVYDSCHLQADCPKPELECGLPLPFFATAADCGSDGSGPAGVVRRQ